MREDAGFTGFARFAQLTGMDQRSGEQMMDFRLGRICGREGALRVASDQSGAAAAELAFAQLGLPTAPVFLSDAAPANRRFLAVQYPSTPVFTDLTARRVTEAGISGAAVVGAKIWLRDVCEVRAVPPGAVDVYVCTLFPAARPDAARNVLKTIAILKPAVAILGFTGSPTERWKTLLGEMRNYRAGWVSAKAYHLGLPQCAAYKFAVLFRRDAVDNVEDACDQVSALVRALRHPPPGGLAHMVGKRRPAP